MLQLAPALKHFSIHKDQFLVRFAASVEELEQAARVRFHVFNRELQAGLHASLALGKDQDQYDEHCHHLILLDQSANKIIGTYRMQTAEIARQYHGFYSSQEFDLGTIPGHVMAHAVEIGRACILKEHRNWRTFWLLWQGIAAYLRHYQKHYLFGCSSLMSRDIAQGYALMVHFKTHDLLHKDFLVYPRKKYQCTAAQDAMDGTAKVDIKPAALTLPKLLQLYLKFGARICSDPALDQEFGSIDFFTIFNIHHIQKKHSPFYAGT